MHLVAAGLSFRTAPISVRERAVVPDSEVNRLLRYLVGHCGLRGAAVLSTCNRTEFYVSCPTTELADEVCPRLALYLDPTGAGEIGEHLFALRDGQAIRHMLRVAAGLESMVVGEVQVLGQFRDAHRMAREAGSLDARLDYVMRRAVSAGKRVRTETRVGRRAGSIADAAVAIAEEIGGSLEGCGVLVLGAGSMSALAAQRLSHAGARLMVASRGGESAVALAATVGGSAVAMEDLVGCAGEVEVILACTNSAMPVLSAADVAAVQAARDHRPLGIVDIAVPRDVEEAASTVPGVTLIDVDEVGDRIPGLRDQQLVSVAEATAIIEAEVAHAVAVVGERDAAAPTIGALVRQAEAVRRAEVERTLARMPDLDPDTAERIQQLSRSLVNKLLHAPITHLRDFADDPAVALTLRDAFDLDATAEVEVEPDQGSAAAS